MSEKHICMPENASKMKEWIANRGGVAIWPSVNLSNPGASWSSPALTEDGKPYPKPTWQAADTPERVITDPSEIVVTVPKEVKRFRVALRLGSQGLSVKLTDASSERVRAAVRKAGEKAWYQFDYASREAVIYVPDKEIPLDQYVGAV